MPKRAAKPPVVTGAVDERVAFVLDELARLASPKDAANLQRFGITATAPFGVAMANVHRLAKQLGRDHALALALWATDRYEARLLTAFVDEPDRVTKTQMDAWCGAADNWAIVDTLCFHLWDRTPHAWAKVAQWVARKPEFVRRGGFALLACLAGHDRESPDERFVQGLVWVEQYADDDRNFVKKAISWALRRIGTRSPAMRKAAIATAKRLADGESAPRRWVGRDALRELTKPPRARKAQ